MVEAILARRRPSRPKAKLLQEKSMTTPKEINFFSELAACQRLAKTPHQTKKELQEEFDIEARLSRNDQARHLLSYGMLFGRLQTG
jgi:hypothetical protein